MSNNKGVYDLNPTDAVMKQGSEKWRSADAGAKHFPKAGRYTEQRSELEQDVHSADHPMMKTRQSSSAEHKHADGRKHEDHHHAVRKLKGE
jgi:hypothetical protein